MPQTEQLNFRVSTEKAEAINRLKEKLDLETNTEILNKAVDVLLQLTEGQEIKSIKIEEFSTQQCKFTSAKTYEKNGINYIYCDNPKKKTLSRDRLIPLAACRNCLERWKETQSKRKFALREINRKMRSYFCWQACEELHREKGTFEFENRSELPNCLSDFPCLKNPQYDCADNDNEDCLLNIHKEWRQLFSKAHLENPSVLSNPEPSQPQ